MSESQAATREGDVVRDLTAFQQNILVILSDKPRYGLAIKHELEEYYGSDVNHGQLYPDLNDLVEMGLVEKSELDKRTNQYALTEAGHDALLDRFDWVFERFVTDDDRADELRSLIEANR